jgi:hypothetical protein
VALSGGRGSGKREAGEDRGGLIELGGYQVKLLGERLRKEGSCRGLDIRAAKFVSRLSEFQASEFQSKDQMVQSIEEVLGGERALKAERTRKPKCHSISRSAFEQRLSICRTFKCQVSHN